MSHALSSVRGSIASIVLLGSVLATGAGLAVWKYSDIAADERAAASQPEPTEAITAAVATERDYRRTTTSIGTVIALRSITLQNELAGTVRQVKLVPGQIVEAGGLLVALDVSVEQAELQAQEAQAALAKTTLDRLEGLREHRATSQEEVDQARAARDVALANMERTRAVINKKMIRAPFRARVGIADVHPGQYLTEGTELTTLQGVAEAAHVDFTVAQRVAVGPPGRRLRHRLRQRQHADSGAHRRRRFAGRRDHPERHGPRPDHRPHHAVTGSVGPGAGSRRRREQGGGGSRRRAPQGSSGRSRVRDRGGLHRQDPRARPAGPERAGAG